MKIEAAINTHNTLCIFATSHVMQSICICQRSCYSLLLFCYKCNSDLELSCYISVVIAEWGQQQNHRGNDLKSNSYLGTLFVFLQAAQPFAEIIEHSQRLNLLSLSRLQQEMYWTRRLMSTYVATRFFESNSVSTSSPGLTVLATFHFASLRAVIPFA